MKDILVSVAGSDGQYKNAQILPGTKARDILASLGLNGMQLSRPDGGAFHHNDNIYDAVETGQKIFASPAKVEAGA